MAKKHISFWIEEKDLKECDANVITSNCKSRSDYVAEAVKFYNSYLHNKNNEDYINQNLKDTKNLKLWNTCNTRPVTNPC